MPPHKTKISTTTNLKTKTNQKCQKIELYESLITKELKKKHSARLVGVAEMGSLGGEDAGQGCGWSTRQALAVPHLHADKLGGTTGEQDRPRNPGIQCREIKPQNL